MSNTRVAKNVYPFPIVSPNRPTRVRMLYMKMSTNCEFACVIRNIPTPIKYVNKLSFYINRPPTDHVATSNYRDKYRRFNVPVARNVEQSVLDTLCFPTNSDKYVFFCFNYNDEPRTLTLSVRVDNSIVCRTGPYDYFTKGKVVISIAVLKKTDYERRSFFVYR